MRRAASTLLLCALMSAGLPTFAHAGIWRWIDELSGPGPYDGWQLEGRLVCFVPDTPDEPARKMMIGKSTCIVTKKSPRRSSRVSINVESGALWAKDNPIDYGTPLSEDAKRVKVIPVQGMVYWEPVKGLELAAGGGVFFFYNKHGLFDRFQRLVVEPMRVDVRPFDFLLKGECRKSWHAKALRSLTFRQSMVYIPKGFTAADFGSSVDSFSTPREVLHSMSMIIDVESFFTK